MVQVAGLGARTEVVVFTKRSHNVIILGAIQWKKPFPTRPRCTQLKSRSSVGGEKAPLVYLWPSHTGAISPSSRTSLGRLHHSG